MLNGSRQVRKVSFFPLTKQVSCSFRTEDVGSLLLILKLDDDFDGDINDIVRAATSIVI